MLGVSWLVWGGLCLLIGAVYTGRLATSSSEQLPGRLAKLRDAMVSQPPVAPAFTVLLRQIRRDVERTPDHERAGTIGARGLHDLHRDAHRQPSGVGLSGQQETLQPHEAVEIAPQLRDQLASCSDHEVELLVVSHPSRRDDRVLVETGSRLF